MWLQSRGKSDQLDLQASRPGVVAGMGMPQVGGYPVLEFVWRSSPKPPILGPPAIPSPSDIISLLLFELPVCPTLGTVVVGPEPLELLDFVVWVLWEESVQHTQPGRLVPQPRAVAVGWGTATCGRLWREESHLCPLRGQGGQASLTCWTPCPSLWGT